jgi:DNA-directed RNA polymerase specialized sigma24 family protein
LDTSYVDEFGPINREVYELAATLWPLAVSLIHRTIQDLQTGQNLMIKAVAIVSRKLAEQPEKMTSLHGYLFRTFSRLVSAEFEKETKHGRLALAQTQAGEKAERSDSDIYNAILLQEALTRADPWTREVAELHIIGYTFEEIGKKFGMKANYVRAKWFKGVTRLTETIRREIETTEKKFLPGGPGRS